jgi:hypothetical protein
MKKTFYAIAISFIMVLFSCKSTIITQHATTEQLTRLEPGMNKDQALTVFTGMYPYDIMMGADEGCEIHVYKYWKPSRKMLRANVQLEAYLSSGKKLYVKEADAFVYYKDGKIVLVSTEGNKGKYFNMLETRANDLKACAGPVKGCTDPTSLSYNPDATQDDGTCKYCECGMVANPDYDSKRALSDCNQPCLPLDENGNPIKWSPKAKNSENGSDSEECNICDMIKAGEKVTLNVNVNSSEAPAARKSGNSKNESIDFKSSKLGSKFSKKDKSRKKSNNDSGEEKSGSSIGFKKPFNK